MISITNSSNETSFTDSKQQDSGISTSKIAAPFSGEFVGLVADNPDEKIKLKIFNSDIINDTTGLNEEIAGYKNIPIVKHVTTQQVLDNYYLAKKKCQKNWNGTYGSSVRLMKSTIKLCTF